MGAWKAGSSTLLLASRFLTNVPRFVDVKNSFFHYHPISAMCPSSSYKIWSLYFSCFCSLWFETRSEVAKSRCHYELAFKITFDITEVARIGGDF